MPKVAEELSALVVKRLTTAGLHFVGGVPGLALQVTPSGARTWVLRARVGGKRRDIGLGGFPAVTLAQAREKARASRDLIKEGKDPVDVSRANREALRHAVRIALTFKQCAETYIGVREAGWKSDKHAKQWRSTLEKYAYPQLGNMLVRDIGKEHVHAVLESIWKTVPETANRVRGRIESVLDWAKSHGYRSGDNPAKWKGNLDGLLVLTTKEIASVEHHAAVPFEKMPEFMRRLAEMDGMGARALEFVILTATRSGEVRGATWGEFDLARATWTIPGARMKAKKEHRVPLSAEALACLDRLPASARAPGDLVFPGSRGGPLSDMTLTAVMRRMEVDAVPHGFRSTFRDWAAECTSYPREVAEMALAHTVKNKVEAAYRRGDLFEKRREMMSDWARAVGTQQHE